VQIPVVVNVARSREEAEKQARGESVAAAAQAESLEAELAAEMAATE
jgi:large subunit ribosomal protein L9